MTTTAAPTWDGSGFHVPKLSSLFYLLLLLLSGIAVGVVPTITESHAQTSPLSIIVTVDSTPDDKGKIKVFESTGPGTGGDDTGDLLKTEDYKTDSKGSTTVTASIPAGKIDVDDEFLVVAKSDEKDLIDSDKSINRPVSAPEHVAVNLFFGKD
jgi:hypothetical protein